MIVLCNGFTFSMVLIPAIGDLNINHCLNHNTSSRVG